MVDCRCIDIDIGSVLIWYIGSALMRFITIALIWCIGSALMRFIIIALIRCIGSD